MNARGFQKGPQVFFDRVDHSQLGIHFQGQLQPFDLLDRQGLQVAGQQPVAFVRRFSRPAAPLEILVATMPTYLGDHQFLSDSLYLH